MTLDDYAKAIRALDQVQHPSANEPGWGVEEPGTAHEWISFETGHRMRVWKDRFGNEFSIDVTLALASTPEPVTP